MLIKATARPGSSLFSWFGNWLGSRKPANASKRPMIYRRLVLERLEDRLAPATLHQAGSILTITLDNTNEALSLVSSGTSYGLTSTNNFVNDGTVGSSDFTGFGTTSGTVTTAGLGLYKEIDIVDTAAAGTSVAFNNSGASAYSTNLAIDLANALAGTITFTGTSTFNNASLFASTPGSITSAAGSVITAGAGTSGDLTLQSTAGSVVLAGSLADTIALASTTVTGNSVQLGSSTNIKGALDVVAVNGAITELGPITTGSVQATFLASGGNITLTNSGNNLGGPVGLSANLTNNITITNNTSLTLANVTLGTGTLSLTARGNITQLTSTNGGIQTGGAVNLAVSGVPGSIALEQAPNSIGGVVTISQVSGGTVTSVALRNVSANASLPAISGLALNSDTLKFDNAPIALPAMTLTGNLSVTAGGAITETGNLTAAGGSFTVLGNFGIGLGTATNRFSGPVSFSNPQADGSPGSAVVFSNSVATVLGNSSLGLSTFNVTASTGNITEATGARITQKHGAGAATFNAAAGTVVALGNAGNDFSGGVVVAGASVTTVSLDNADTLASMPVLPGSVTSLSLTFEEAPAVLPSFTGLSSLTVTAQGIAQATGASLAVSGLATFNAGSFPIQLNRTGNTLPSVALTNSGPSDVVVDSTGGISLGSCQVGSGRLTVNAGGAIVQTGAIVQANNAGAASFTTGAFAITLGQANTFTGPVSVSNTGANNISIDGGVLVLGSCSVGGAFQETAAGGSIFQAPGTSLTVTGAATFTASSGQIMLNNAGNTFSGGVGLSAILATLASSAALQLNTTSVFGSLTVSAGGAVTQTGAISAGTASFSAGTNAIDLTNSGNAFGSGGVSLSSTGSGDVALANSAALTLGTLSLGSGALTVTASGDILQASGAITQTGPGAITLSGGPTHNVALTQPGNDLPGTITVNAKNVLVTTKGNLTFTAGSTMTGEVVLTAGGLVTLPASNLSVASLAISAQETDISHNLTAGGNMIFDGKVVFTTAVTLDTSASSAGGVQFQGDVTAAGTLTIHLPNGGSAGVSLSQGVWNQGTNDLTITGIDAGLTIGGLSGLTATLAMTSGTISLTGQGDLTVNSNGALAVGGSLSGQKVTVANGTGTIDFQPGSRLLVGLGATNDELVDAGTGNVNVGGATLEGTGLAGTTASPVLGVSDVGQIVGFFAQTVDAHFVPHDFFIGSDIVTPDYTGLAVTIQQGGTVSTTGKVTGFESDSDQYVVTVTGGAAAQLVVLKDIAGNIAIVVRNAAVARTLTLTTTKTAGDGLITVDGIAFDGPGAASIMAPTANVTGDIRLAGPLSALVIHDMTGGAITAAGKPAQSTSITGRVFDHVTIAVGSALGNLQVAAFTNSPGTLPASSIVADRFGTITATGNSLAEIAGNFTANLTNLNAAHSTLPAVAGATIAANLSGKWDLQGSVGTVTATSTSNWELGLPGGADVFNPDLLTSVAALSLGTVVNSSIEAIGRVSAVTATSWNTGNLEAASFGTIQTTGNANLGDIGDFTLVNVTATGNAGSAVGFRALGTLAVAGDLAHSTLVLQNGTANAITVGRTASSSTITALSTAQGGTIASVTVGAWNGTSLDAKSVGSLRAVGNVAASLFGDFSNSNITLQGVATATNGVALGSFSASHNVSADDFTVENGSVSAFSVGRQMQLTNITLEGATTGTLGAISVGDWSQSNLTALSIGSLTVTGAVEQLPSSPSLIGNLDGSTIDVFLAKGATPALGTFSVAGQLDSDTISAGNGISSFAVRRDMTGDSLAVANSLAGNQSVGRIRTLSAGSWQNTSLEVQSLGTVSVTGFSTPELGTSRVRGDFMGSQVVVNGGTMTNPVGIGTLLVAGNFGGDTLDVPFGITTMSVGGQISGSLITVENPVPAGVAQPTIGRIAMLTVGDWSGGTLRANTFGSVKTTGNTGLGLEGDFAGAQIAVAGLANATVAIGNVSIAGNFANDTLNAPGTIGSFAVARSVLGSELAAGFGTNAGIKVLTVGSWSQSALTTRSIVNWGVVGNSNVGLTGDVSGSQITILGNLNNVGLGNFLASGTINGSRFDVTDGNVTSFAVGRFFDSTLLVGFRLPKAVDLTSTPASANWDTTNRSIGLFKTTVPFNSSDVADTASFRASDVVAASIGTVVIAGLDPNVPSGSDTTFFGVGFRGTGGAAGKVRVDGVLSHPGFTSGAFLYKGLAG